MIDYSIIIPHKNIPDLLQRCLDSIPVREDIQVIVVDDNSEADKVDFGHFPRWKGENYEYYLTKEGRGAGYARNVGLKYAKGKWLVFLDADDMLVDKVENILMEIVNRTEDIIYFDTICVMSEDLSKPSNRNFYHKFFEQYCIDKDESAFRYRFHSLWGKVFKTDFINKYHICFDETRYSNDVMFSISAGIYAQRIAIDSRVLFIVTEREGSLASNQFGQRVISKEECITRLSVAIRVRELLEKNNLYKEEHQVDEYLGKLRALYKSAYYHYLLKLTFTHRSYVMPFFKREILYVLKKLHVLKS